MSGFLHDRLALGIGRSGQEDSPLNRVCIDLFNCKKTLNTEHNFFQPLNFLNMNAGSGPRVTKCVAKRKSLYSLSDLPQKIYQAFCTSLYHTSNLFDSFLNTLKQSINHHDSLSSTKDIILRVCLQNRFGSKRTR